MPGWRCALIVGEVLRTIWHAEAWRRKAEIGIMSRKAVDIVVLPDEAMTSRAIEANRKLVERFGARLVLDRERCLPHISLAMGCMADEDLEAVAGVLEKVAAGERLGPLKVVGVVVSTNAIGEKVSLFEVERAESLQKLHEAVMYEVQPYLSPEVTREMMYHGWEVEDGSLVWIRDYGIKSSLENFFPHITIGYGVLEEGGFPAEFSASRLALCHLGNHCTCREVLAAVELRSN